MNQQSQKFWYFGSRSLNTCENIQMIQCWNDATKIYSELTQILWFHRIYLKYYIIKLQIQFITFCHRNSIKWVSAADKRPVCFSRESRTYGKCKGILRELFILSCLLYSIWSGAEKDCLKLSFLGLATYFILYRYNQEQNKILFQGQFSYL